MRDRAYHQTLHSHVIEIHLTCIKYMSLLTPENGQLPYIRAPHTAGDADSAALLADAKNGMSPLLAQMFGASHTHMMAPTENSDLYVTRVAGDPSVLLSEVGGM